MVTGAGDEELVVTLLRLGALDYVPKRGTYLETLPDVLRTTISQQRRLQQTGLRVGPRHHRALYVERNEADIDLTLRHFAESARHWNIDVARSCRDALRLLPDGQFDLVMTDLRMPDMTALELLREAKHRGLQMPFIILTGGGDEAAAVAALKLGAYDYIVKRDGYLTQLPSAADNAVDRFQLEQANVRLEAELAQRARLQAALGEHAAALADAARQKDEFLAMLGHELRNPLAPIRTALELMRRTGADDAATQRAHEVMGRQIAHMVRLVNDLLDVSRITSGRIILNVQAVDLRQVIADAVDSVRPLIDARRQHLEMTIAPNALPVRGDVTRLMQVIVNLLDNAAKYTAEEGAIRLDASRDRGHVVVSIADTASASRRGSCPGSSTCSPRTNGRSTVRKAASGSGSRSSGASPSCTAAAWKLTVRAAARAASSS
jgi:signal transduction histidine kinase